MRGNECSAGPEVLYPLRVPDTAPSAGSRSEGIGLGCSQSGRKTLSVDQTLSESLFLDRLRLEEAWVLL